MAANGQYPNSRPLWINKRRNHPKSLNLRGDARITIDGKEVELTLAAWTKEKEDGEKFLQVKFELKTDFKPNA